jgi:hypothetical protein
LRNSKIQPQNKKGVERFSGEELLDALTFALAHRLTCLPLSWPTKAKNLFVLLNRVVLLGQKQWSFVQTTRRVDARGSPIEGLREGVFYSPYLHTTLFRWRSAVFIFRLAFTLRTFANHSPTTTIARISIYILATWRARNRSNTTPGSLTC